MNNKINEIDLVLLDINMKPISGFEISKTFRQNGYNGKIIGISGMINLKNKAINIKSSIVEISKNDLIKLKSKLFISLFLSNNIIVNKLRYIQYTNIANWNFIKNKTMPNMKIIGISKIIFNNLDWNISQLSTFEDLKLIRKLLILSNANLKAKLLR